MYVYIYILIIYYLAVHTHTHTHIYIYIYISSYENWLLLVTINSVLREANFLLGKQHVLCTCFCVSTCRYR